MAKSQNRANKKINKEEKHESLELSLRYQKLL
jgi:hypothetical protein